MYDLLLDYGLFLLKAITVLIVILIIIGAAAVKKKSTSGELKISSLNKKFQHMKEAIQEATLDKKIVKQEAKAKKKAEKEEKKKQKEGDVKSKPRLFVVDFEGDIKASSVPSLREEITAILAASKPDDEVLVRLNNSGGIVHEHGLAASQLVRLKQANLPLTVAVDKVAASGGYMMACVADKILSAPFAIVGSIGVVAQLPNFHRLLDKAGVDFEQHTAGEYKRNVTMFGKNTKKERDQLKEQLEDIHDLFRGFVTDYRPSLDMKEVGTGQYWYGSRAKELGLVDEIMTSDDFLAAVTDKQDIFQVKYEFEKTFMEKFSRGSAQLFEKAINKLARVDN